MNPTAEDRLPRPRRQLRPSAPEARRAALTASPGPFQAFLARHREPVLAFLRAMLGPDEAEDAFQETFIAALRAYERMDGCHPRAWVMTIARRKAIDHHRARRRRPEPRAQLPEAQTSDEPPDREIWSAVAELPDGQRAAIALRYAADLPYAEIAAALGTSEAAARRRVADGLASLRRSVARSGENVDNEEARS